MGALEILFIIIINSNNDYFVVFVTVFIGKGKSPGGRELALGNQCLVGHISHECLYTAGYFTIVL